MLGEARREKLLFATLFLGANDSAPLQDDPLCSGVPLDEYEENLRDIALKLQDVAEALHSGLGSQPGRTELKLY